MKIVGVRLDSHTLGVRFERAGAADGEWVVKGKPLVAVLTMKTPSPSIHNQDADRCTEATPSPVALGSRMS